jgi:hypothetical protein
MIFSQTYYCGRWSVSLFLKLSPLIDAMITCKDTDHCLLRLTTVDGGNRYQSDTDYCLLRLTTVDRGSRYQSDTDVF